MQVIFKDQECVPNQIAASASLKTQHTPAQLFDPVISSISHNGWIHYEQMDTISLKSSTKCFGLLKGTWGCPEQRKTAKKKKINEHRITLSHKKPQHRK